MVKTIPFRIPKKDYVEIRKIANELDITIGSAYSIWKKNNKIGLNIFEWKKC